MTTVKEIPAKLVAELRARTGAGMMDCKSALQECGGDLDKAVDILRKKGAAKAEKRAEREASEGWIGPYVHHDGSVAVLVELNSETDFVARTDDLKELAKEIAVHGAATKPLAVRIEDLPADVVERERRVYESQVAEQKKPENIRAKIVDGMIKKFYEENVLLEQKFVKDDKRTVGELVKELSARTGEKIDVRRFARLKVGEGWVATAPRPRLAYPRALLKISGEAFAGPRGAGGGIDFAFIDQLGDELKHVAGVGVQLGLVVGGGNILRGTAASEQGMDRVSADYMGMLATVINALALQDILEKKGVDTRVMTAIRMEELAEPYIRRRAVRHLEKGRMVIFAGGTGNPYFSTDTAAVLRALEIEAKVLLKATNVDGVYTADPKQDPKAKFLPELSFRDALVNGYAVMDANAFGLCKENKLPIVVFNINQPGATARVLAGERVGTIVQ